MGQNTLVEKGRIAVKRHFDQLGILMGPEDINDLSTIYALGYAHAYIDFSTDFKQEKETTEKIIKSMVETPPMEITENVNRQIRDWRARLSALLSFGIRVQRRVPLGSNLAHFTSLEAGHNPPPAPAPECPT